MNADDVIAVAFGRSADGYLAARVEDIAFIAIPVKDGLRIATGWRLRKSIDQWTAADVYGASATVADEAAFQTHVEENAQHRRQLRTLGRREVRQRLSTPWGLAPSSEIYATGVVFHSNASHGGIKLDCYPKTEMPRTQPLSGRGYEDNGEWAKA